MASSLLLRFDYRYIRRFSSKAAAYDSARNYYDVLGVSRGATSKQIRDAYIRLLKTHHPNTSTGTSSNHTTATNRFMEVREAYEVLSKVATKASYDRRLAVKEDRGWFVDGDLKHGMNVDRGGYVNYYTSSSRGPTTDYFRMRDAADLLARFVVFYKTSPHIAIPIVVISASIFVVSSYIFIANILRPPPEDVQRENLRKEHEIDLKLRPGFRHLF